MSKTPYDTHLGKTSANHQPLTPLTFLERSASVHPDHVAVIHGRQRFTYAQLYERSRRLASALAWLGIQEGDTVSVMLPNVPPMLEAHFGVPMTGAVLHSINTRLDAAIVAFQLDHAEAKVLIYDREFSATVKAAMDLCRIKPRLVEYDDPEFPQVGERLSPVEYEDFIKRGFAGYKWRMPADEWDAISLNYTSGTTGNPKGVVYHHRGAHLMCYANIVSAQMSRHSVYLWTLPMFHCNGWCFPWTLAAVAGTSVCLRRVSAATIYGAIADHGVTHFCGAPIVLGFVINATEKERRPFDHVVNVMTAAAPPPAATLERMERMGFRVTHVYGLTETYGPAVMCAWHPEWNDLPIEEQARIKSRQGVRYHALEGLSVMDPETMTPVPADGETMGEVMFKGNIVMKGYLKNAKASREAFAGGWFHWGDLGVMHPDGYLQIKDRSKDIIISGGENISSIEVESVLAAHPAVVLAAVVAKPDEKWGETPCAFVELKEGVPAPGADEIIAFCRERLAGFKCPRHVVFGPLPKTSTGKIQKFKLRDLAKGA